MGTTAPLKDYRRVGKVIFIVFVAFVIGHYSHSDSLREYEQYQHHTSSEYVEDFRENGAYQNESVETPEPLWAYFLFSLVVLSLFIAFYELAGIGLGWSVRRIRDIVAAGPQERRGQEMYTSYTIPQTLQARVNRELEPMEVIRWIEQPIPRYFTPRARACFVFAIPWTAFAVFWTCGAAGFKLPNFAEGINGVELFPLFGIPFILIGLGMLSSPLWAYRTALKTVCVITDRRAITFDGGQSSTIHSYPPEKLQDVYRKENTDGTGDVILSLHTWRDSDDQQRSEELGFLRVRDPMQFEHMLKELAEQKLPADRH
jgi:hypothetical protein